MNGNKKNVRKFTRLMESLLKLWGIDFHYKAKKTNTPVENDLVSEGGCY